MTTKNAPYHVRDWPSKSEWTSSFFIFGWNAWTWEKYMYMYKCINLDWSHFIKIWTWLIRIFFLIQPSMQKSKAFWRPWNLELFHNLSSLESEFRYFWILLEGAYKESLPQSNNKIPWTMHLRVSGALRSDLLGRPCNLTEPDKFIPHQARWPIWTWVKSKSKTWLFRHGCTEVR